MTKEKKKEIRNEYYKYEPTRDEVRVVALLEENLQELFRQCCGYWK